jgi:hypothetical protein
MKGQKRLPDKDYTHLAPAVTALADRLDTVIAELADVLAARQQLSDQLFALLGDADFDECDRAAEETGMRRLIGGCLQAHALLRGWCLPDKVEQQIMGDDFGPPRPPLRLVD